MGNNDEWEELHRSVTDPWLIKPGPTWIIISTRGKQTARSEGKARAIEKQLGPDWVRTHHLDSSINVRRPVLLAHVAWEKRMVAGYRGVCDLICGTTINVGDDIVLATRAWRRDGANHREGWVHTGCATAGVLLP